MNELWAILAGVMIGTLPPTAAPDVVITYQDVETSVAQYLETEQQTPVIVKCGTGKITIPANGEYKETCKLTNSVSKTSFNADVTLKATDSKVSLKAVILSDTGKAK